MSHFQLRSTVASETRNRGMLGYCQEQAVGLLHREHGVVNGAGDIVVSGRVTGWWAESGGQEVGERELERRGRAANGVSDRSSGTQEPGPACSAPQIPRLPLSPPLLARPGRLGMGRWSMVDEGGGRHRYSACTRVRTCTCGRPLPQQERPLVVHPARTAWSAHGARVGGTRPARSALCTHPNQHTQRPRCTTPAWRPRAMPTRAARAGAGCPTGRSIEA